MEERATVPRSWWRVISTSTPMSAARGAHLAALAPLTNATLAQLHKTRSRDNTGYIKLICNGVAKASPGGTGETSPHRNSANLQRMENSPRISQQIESIKRKNLTNSLIFSKYLIKCFKTFKCKNLYFQTFTTFSQNTVINLIYNTV